jgi:hypothetical protein
MGRLPLPFKCRWQCWVGGPVGPTSILSLVRVLGRNLPLVLMLVAMGVWFWSTSNKNTVFDQDTGDAVDPKVPVPSRTFPSSGLHQAGYP